MDLFCCHGFKFFSHGLWILMFDVFSKFIQWNCTSDAIDVIEYIYVVLFWPLLSSMHGNSLQLSGYIRTKPRVWRGTSAVALVRGGRWGEYTSDGLAGLQLLLQLVIIIMAETRVPFLVPLPRAASVLCPRLMFAFCKWTLDARCFCSDVHRLDHSPWR